MSSTTSNPQPWWCLFNRYHWSVFIVASLAWLFDCLDQQVFNLSRDGAVDDLLADKSKAIELAAYTTSFFLTGWAIGGLIFGSLGDRFGRARILTVSLLIYSICTGLSSFASSYSGFCACVFFTGLGVGGVFGLSVALVADSVPEQSRAPALGLLQSLSSWGNIAAGLTGMGIGILAVKNFLPFGLKAWQAMFLAGALPAFLCVFVLAKLKEPEKWTKARAEGAKVGVKFGSYLTLLKHPTWSKHAWLGLILCSAGIVGLWGIGNFHPKIVRSIIETHLAASNLSPSEMASKKAYWSSLGLLLQNIGGFFGMLSLAKFAQVKGRRPAFAVALLLSFFCTQLVFRYLREINQIYWMLPIMGFGQYSVFGVYAIYLPELFPTSLRSTGTSFCYNFGRLVAASAPFTIGRITKSLGGNIEGFRTAGMWVSLVLLLGIVVLPFLPETKDKLLPE
ncbi:MAG TPA: MFS transporter [Candidatus Baltobacteraceae bacterium]|nr:MFS transporter [Candidatus Baltobacteraceae bacterium]